MFTLVIHPCLAYNKRSVGLYQQPNASPHSSTCMRGDSWIRTSINDALLASNSFLAPRTLFINMHRQMMVCHVIASRALVPEHGNTMLRIKSELIQHISVGGNGIRSIFRREEYSGARLIQIIFGSGARRLLKNMYEYMQGNTIGLILRKHVQ